MISVGLREARLLSQPVVDGDGLVQPQCLLKLGQHPGKNVQLFFSKLALSARRKRQKENLQLPQCTVVVWQLICLFCYLTKVTRSAGKNHLHATCYTAAIVMNQSCFVISELFL